MDDNVMDFRRKQWIKEWIEKSRGTIDTEMGEMVVSLNTLVEGTCKKLRAEHIYLSEDLPWFKASDLLIIATLIRYTCHWLGKVTATTEYDKRNIPPAEIEMFALGMLSDFYQEELQQNKEMMDKFVGMFQEKIKETFLAKEMAKKEREFMADIKKDADEINRKHGIVRDPENLCGKDTPST